MSDVLLVDGLSVVLNSDPAATLIMEQLSIPEPASRPMWITGADSQDARLVRAPLHENRVITAQVRVKAQVSMDAAFDAIGALLDKFAKAAQLTDGVPLTYAPHGTARQIVFDLLLGETEHATLDGGQDTVIRDLYNAPFFTVRMTCKPYWRRSTEESVSTTSSTAPVMSITVPSVGGDVPALGRLVVTDPASQNRRYLEWGLEQRDYTASAAVILDSDADLVTTGFSGIQATVTGAYDPNATGNNAISATISEDPIAVCGTGNQLHVGTWRVRGRFHATGALSSDDDIASVKVRLSWRDGDGPLASNAWQSLPVAKEGVWQEVDLGSITVSKAVAGTQRWSGRIDAMINTGTGVTTGLSIDYLVLIPASEGYGKALALTPTAIETLSARDTFLGTTAGNVLNLRTATTGGSWATSGATTDFVFEDLNAVVESVQRSTSVIEATPRFAILGATNYTNWESRLTIYSQYPQSSWLDLYHGVIVRWTDASNYCVADLNPKNGAFRVRTIVAGVATTVATRSLGSVMEGGRYYRMRLMALASGVVIARFEIWTGVTHQPLGTLEGFSSALATGGTLATGKPGFSDQSQTSGVSQTRHYVNFTGGAPEAEQLVIASGQTLEVRHDDVIREDSGGTAYGRPGSYRGTHLLIPPAGADSKTTRIVVRANRVNLDTTEHSTLNDNLTIQAFWTERGISVPRA